MEPRLEEVLRVSSFRFPRELRFMSRIESDCARYALYTCKTKANHDIEFEVLCQLLHCGSRWLDAIGTRGRKCCSVLSQVDVPLHLGCEDIVKGTQLTAVACGCPTKSRLL